jgi:hypothetical protein
MIRSDYIMRMIEQLSQVLVQIIFHKRNEEYDQAVVQINRALKSLVGLEPETIHSLSAEEIIQLLKLGDRFESEKCLVVAKLIKEDAEVMQLSNPGDQSIDRSYEKSLYLYLEALLAIPDFEEESYLKDISELIGKLQDYPVTQTLKFKLFRYYEWCGQYARAENLLFELVESDYPEIRPAGIKFYQRLRHQSDADLILGGLPRSEVEEGLREISDNHK